MERLQRLLTNARGLGSSLTPEADALEVLEKELQMMEKAIDEAARKMAEILSNSRASHTGVKLEVNEKLIETCTALMMAIRVLVQKAKILQAEIVAQGKVQKKLLIQIFVNNILFSLGFYISCYARRVQHLIKNSTKGIISGLRVLFLLQRLLGTVPNFCCTEII